MLDNKTVVIYGWKLTGKTKDKFQDSLEAIDENYYDLLANSNVYVDDTMCGEYIYVGAVLANYDADEGDYVIINDKLIKKCTDNYNKFINTHEQYKELFNKTFKNKEPQLYVFQNIY